MGLKALWEIMEAAVVANGTTREASWEVGNFIFNSVPDSVELLRGCVARWFAFEPLYDQRVQFYHLNVVVICGNNRLPGDARRERGNGGKDGCLGDHCVPGGVVG